MYPSKYLGPIWKSIEFQHGEVFEVARKTNRPNRLTNTGHDIKFHWFWGVQEIDDRT